MDPLFHPFVSAWFRAHFAAPSAPQEFGWPLIASGRDTLIAAPTGSGKTLAAFLWTLDGLVREAAEGALTDEIRAVYVSPLRALSNDVQKNLQLPLKEIGAAHHLPEIRVEVRTGDTPQKVRERIIRTPPHVLVTTPESLFILLTARRGRDALRHTRFVIVDEIHAVAADKRGTHLALSLERLDALAGRKLQRIGLSATQKPIEGIARLLVGTRDEPCAIVDAGHQRALDLSIELPDRDLAAVATHELWDDVYTRLCARINAHRTTIVFVNTRRLVERVAHELSTRLGGDRVAAHHGSMSRTSRLDAEQKLKRGDIAAIVATASLELGIDVGSVDLVCHLGAPRSIATLLQRVGRSGHWLGATPRGVIYPMTRDELVQCAAAVRAVRLGRLDAVLVPQAALDILAQQIVAIVASEAGEEGMAEDALYASVRRAWPYRDLTRDRLEEVLHLLAEGTNGRKGRRGAWLHHDRVNRRLWARRGARMTAITSGGAIPDTADYDVIEAPDETFVGRINEDFAIESMAGDVFLLGNRSWRILRVAAGRVYVQDAHGLPPTVPFWFGEAPSRTQELSEAVCEIRDAVEDRLPDTEAARRWLREESGCETAAADQIVAYIATAASDLGCVPTRQCVVAERFFDESGGMQLVLHAPFGGRINRAWGLALRKRFCVTFDFELQAAATDDGVVLSLGEQHSFPLESIFGYVRNHTLERDLESALVGSPMFVNRWRWNSARSLALPRFQGGRKVPMAIQRMRAEDLLSAVAPQATACQDNRTGPIDLGDHPLIRETLRDCLHEAMDVDGLRHLIDRIERGEIRCVAIDTPAPSAFSCEILNARPYAFLDDAPLEERRSRAVNMRRGDRGLQQAAGALDADAIAEVRVQAWPSVRSANDLHDALLGLMMVPLREAHAFQPHLDTLLSAGRAAIADRQFVVAAERLRAYRMLHPLAQWEPALTPPPAIQGDASSVEEAVRAVVHGWLDVLGPVTVDELARRCGLASAQVEMGLVHLEANGVALQGYFTPRGGDDAGPIEWCERGLLARIHRLTLGNLRREIEPVTAADFIRFLLRWQHVAPRTQLHGTDGIVEIVGQLQGFELPAAAWEEHVLPRRLAQYVPSDLEHLCLAGAVCWGRLRGEPSSASPGRGAAIGFMLRDDVPSLLPPMADAPRDGLSDAATRVLEALDRHGASFLSDIARLTAQSIASTEDALWELVAHGRVSGDGVAGLRGLLRTVEPPPRPLRAVDGGRAARRLLPLGRWCLWRTAAEVKLDENGRAEFWASQLLRRYGVVFRDAVARETQAPPWRAICAALRRLEAQGRIRGGRFVSGFIGEQYALAEAVDALRAVRRVAGDGEVVVVAAADPLNLVGILTPGPRLSPYSAQGILYRNGVPIESGPYDAVRRTEMALKGT